MYIFDVIGFNSTPIKHPFVGSKKWGEVMCDDVMLFSKHVQLYVKLSKMPKMKFWKPVICNCSHESLCDVVHFVHMD